MSDHSIEEEIWPSGESDSDSEEMCGQDQTTPPYIQQFFFCSFMAVYFQDFKCCSSVSVEIHEIFC